MLKLKSTWPRRGRGLRSNMAETILIEFQADTSGLSPAIDQLEALGKVDKATAATFKATNAELAKRTASLKATASATQQSAAGTKKSIQDVDAAVKNLTNDFVEGFQEGVTEALKEAGVSAEEFAEALKTGGTEVEAVTTSVRGRLREIVQELALMRSRGEEATNPERYAELTREAGNLRDSLADVNEQINRAGSDTGGFDSLIQVAQGVAGGFAVAQGAAALFGEESEELQEVLLRVNATMAILQGLQQLQATWAARLAVARGLETAATSAQTVAQQAYNVVVGQSIGLMRVLRLAFAATVIGALIIAFIEVVKWITATSKQIRNLIRDMQLINAEFENGIRILDAYSEAIRRNSDENIATLESNNVLASEISKQRINDAQQELQAVLELEKERRAQYELSRKALIEFNRLREEGDAIVNKEGFKKLEEEHLKYVQAFEDLEKRRLNSSATIRQQQVAREAQLNQEALQAQIAITERALLQAREGSRAQLELQQKLVRDKLALDLATQALTEAQRLQLVEQSYRDQQELRLSFTRRELQAQVAAIEERLKFAEEGSIQEFTIRQELVRKQAAAELTTNKLSAAERMNIEETASNEIYQLELSIAARRRQIAVDFKAFLIQNSKDVQQIIINDAISRNAAELALLQEGTQERLVAELAAIELQATQERVAAGKNALEIQRIDAEAQARKLQVRRQFFEQAAEAELRIESAKNGRLVRGQQQVLNDQRSTFAQRIRAINEIFLIEAGNIDKQKQNLRDQFKQGLISQQEYNVRYAELEDQRAAISEQTEQQILEATRARIAQQIQASVEVTSQLIGVLDSVYQAQSDREQQRIDEQRARVDELRESGAITEKEAQRRQKLLEIEDRKAQQRQAQRERQIALFRAALAIPQAFLQGLAQGGPILGAIYAGIAAGQFGILASRPIPKFGKGKKDSYQGPGEIGETGAELMEKNGQMYIATKPTIVWLGAKDKVYNPKESAAMMEKPGLRAARIPEGMDVQVAAGLQFDYERLGKEISRHQNGLSLNIDGYKNFVIKGHAFDTYLNSRRGY